MIDFEEEYWKYFEQKTWVVNEKYQFSHKKAIVCWLMRKDWKKAKRVILIEDSYHFVVTEAEPEGKEYRVLVIANWIKVSFEMNRDESTRLEVSIVIKKDKDSFSLLFDDQVRSNNVLASFNEVKWQRYEEELYFISKFLSRTLNNE
jgi:hypothetical protein